MAKTYSRITEIALLRNSTTAATASAADTELTNARIQNFKAGVAVVTVPALDITSGDESYTIIIEGRESSSGAYVTLGQLVLSAAKASVAGVYLVDLDNISSRIRSRLVAAGTTPSITYLVSVLGMASPYHPASGAAITN